MAEQTPPPYPVTDPEKAQLAGEGGLPPAPPTDAQHASSEAYPPQYSASAYPPPPADDEEKPPYPPTTEGLQDRNGDTRESTVSDSMQSISSRHAGHWPAASYVPTKSTGFKA